MTEKTRMFCCCKCGKTYSRKARLKAHETKHHGGVVSDDGNKMPCAVPGCKFSAATRARMRVHLYTEHKLKVQRGILTFSNKTDYLNWKCAEEREQVSMFIATSAPKPLKNGARKTYLACHRSATSKTSVDNSVPSHVSRPTKKRRKVSKSQGSCKTDIRCPASMDVEECADGSVRVVYYRTHCGHSKSLAHQRLSKEERAVIAGQLAEGFTIDEILNDVQDSLGAEELSRKHLISRHDLRNIAKANGLTPKPNGSRQEDDAIESTCIENGHENHGASVDMWVEDLRHVENIPVLFYKPQGMVTESSLDEDDFIIVIMTTVQQEMLKEFGGDKICVESTHSTNEYDLYLSTIMVIDEFGMAFPAAFCCSNKTGPETFQIYFSSVLDAVGCVQCNVFMSDDDGGVLYNAWTAVMGVPDRRLLCPWAVDANWRQKLKEVNGGVEEQAGIYKTLRLLLEETDETNFQQLLEDALFQFSCDPHTAEFREYFLNHYANRVQLWASCYKLQAGVDCIVSLEAMHRLLKHVFFNSLGSKRVDECLTGLLRTARDKSFERLRKLVNRRADHRKVFALKRRHEGGARIPDANVSRAAEDTWEVTAQGWGGKTYCVRKCPGQACADCDLSCPTCRVCAHSHTCTCVDSTVDGNMCEHIHKVTSMCGPVGVNSCTVDSRLPVVVDHEEDNEVQRLKESMQVDATRCPTNEARVALETRLECFLETVRSLPHDSVACEEAGRLIDEATALVERAMGVMVSGDPEPGTSCATEEIVAEATDKRDPCWTVVYHIQ